MKTRELLEKNKDRLLEKLERSDTPEQAADICNEELGRILLQYHESTNDTQMTDAASYSLATARAALSLIDSAGETKIYERVHARNKRSGGPAVLTALLGAGLSALSAFMLTMGPPAFATIGCLCMAAGVILAFAGGIGLGGRRAKAPETDRYLETRPDPSKIYRALGTTLTVVDRNLEEAYERSAVQAEQLSAPEHRAGDISEEELNLLSGILETAYSRQDPAEAGSVVSDIRFYLHRKNIDVCEYTEETARWFHRMPSKRTGTLRPALVRDGAVLVKGIAAGGENI